MGDSDVRAKVLLAAGLTLALALGLFLAFAGPGGLGGREANEIRLGLFAGSAWKVPNPTTNRLYDGLIADFRAQHPRYMIKYRSGVRAQDYSERLAQDLVKGEEPDLFFILPEDFTTLASIGALADLGPLMRDSGVDPSIFYENALAAGRFRERQYALPFEVVPSLMFVNLSLLGKLGLSLPSPSWRWEDFLACSSAATQDRDGNGTLDTFGISGYTWPDAAYSNRELLFDDAGNNAMLEQDGVVDAVDFFLRLGAPARGTIVPDFESGAVLFAPFPYSSYRAYKYYPYSIQRFGDFRWRALTMPRGPKGGNAGELRVLLAGMSRRAANRKASWEFLRHITTEDEAAYRILAFSQGLPARRGLLDTERARASLEQHISGDEEPLDPALLEALVEGSVVAPRFRNHNAALEMVSRAIAAERPQSSSSLRNFLSKLDHSIDSFLKE
jgi:multiple sugar transport system substrate-binding protein